MPGMWKRPRRDMLAVRPFVPPVCSVLPSETEQTGTSERSDRDKRETHEPLSPLAFLRFSDSHRLRVCVIFLMTLVERVSLWAPSLRHFYAVRMVSPELSDSGSGIHLHEEHAAIVRNAGEC